VPPRNRDLFIGREASEKEAREVKRAYWASVSFLDEQVGRVLAALDEFGFRDNTIVVFWGDHGYHLGEKGKWSKHGSLWEVGLHVPFMISVPGSASNGKVCTRVVECLGLYPTLVELCGLPTAPGQQGASVVPLLRDPSAAWDRPALSVSYQQRVLGRSVRTDRWHYADWDYGRAGAMLIDSANDPGETKNLANDPTRASVVAEMKQYLERLPPLETKP
jgi:arylsulfatase A-like enzyme